MTVIVTLHNDRPAFTRSGGWWDSYPNLALFIAAGVDESGGTPAVPESLLASDDEAKLAEQQLDFYPGPTVREMGYYGLVPADYLKQYNPDAQEFMAYEIASRYY